MDEHFESLALGREASGLSIHHGFPNPSDTRLGEDSRLSLDLNQLLVRHPAATYLFRISGHRWSDQGIYDGDVAVIDRSAKPLPNDLIVIWDDSNDFKLQRIFSITAEDETPWGVVTAIIHQYR